MIVLLGLALVLAGCGSGTRTPDPTMTGFVHGTPVHESVELPNVVLRDTADQAYRLSATPTAPIVVLVFGYAHCDERCSTAPRVLAAALAHMSSADRARVTALFITVDPQRDSPRALGKWLDEHAPGLIGLTGDPGTIDHVAARVGVPISGKQHRDDGYVVGHGTQITAFGPDRFAAVVWDQDLAPEQLAADLRILVAG